MSPTEQFQPVPTVLCDYIPEKRRADEKHIKHDSIPHLCHIELTYACNQKCLFCYNPERARLGDISIVDKIVENIAKSQIPHVYLIGGEPSLIPVKKLNEYIELLSDHSSVTIVTNGLKRLEKISDKLACFGVPLHGSKPETHEFLNKTKGSFLKTTSNIKYYIDSGFDVRCIPVLTGYNFNQMYDIINIAANLEMESVYVDRYEDGGLGATSSKECLLKPTSKQFYDATTQIIKAKKDFEIFEGRVGFGTAIPYCIDKRLITNKITSNCGVGSTFCAINPKGEFRICNQSQLVFGNILEESIEKIWSKKSIDIFRNLLWVREPCNSCSLILECTGGCKVDTSCSDKFCIDYAVRKKIKPISKKEALKFSPRTLSSTYPKEYRNFKINKYTKLSLRPQEKFVVTRYQTVKLNNLAAKILTKILNKSIKSEKNLIKYFANKIEEKEIRIFLSRLFQIEALDFVESDKNVN